MGGSHVSRYLPAAPTNGRPVRSSSAPGPSPMNITGGSSGPSPGTVVFLFAERPHFTQEATSAAIAASEPARSCPTTGPGSRVPGTLEDQLRMRAGVPRCQPVLQEVERFPPERYASSFIVRSRGLCFPRHRQPFREKGLARGPFLPRSTREPDSMMRRSSRAPSPCSSSMRKVPMIVRTIFQRNEVAAMV